MDLLNLKIGETEFVSNYYTSEFYFEDNLNGGKVLIIRTHLKHYGLDEDIFIDETCRLLDWFSEVVATFPNDVKISFKQSFQPGLEITKYVSFLDRLGEGDKSPQLNDSLVRFISFLAILSVKVDAPPPVYIVEEDRDLFDVIDRFVKRVFSINLNLIRVES